MSKKYIPKFPNNAKLLGFCGKNRIIYSLYQPIRRSSSDKRFICPETLILNRTTRKHGSIEVIIRKFDSCYKTPPTQNMHNITVKITWFKSPKYEYHYHDTNCEKEALKIIQDYLDIISEK